MPRALRLGLTLLLCGATALAAHALGASRERPYDLAILPRAAAMRWLSLGHETLAANLMWLRVVQYIGEPRAEQRGWEKLHPAVDLVTDLDPRHGYAYQVAGVILGSVSRVPESNAILEKGFAALPGRYSLAVLRAFNAFYYQDDWATAGRWAEAAARAPGAPAHLRQTVLAYYVKGNRADAAIAFLEEALRTAADPESKKAIEGQLKIARYEAAAATIDEALERYRAHRPLGPLWVERLVTDGYLPGLPRDPFGGRWEIGDDGRARSSAQRSRYRRPTRLELGPEPGLAR
ncbi:MAG: tetratricopeptide repeat protein [Deltaproteobacteria bacterium]|nr:tetratricopeptide repeat protein [Deltaproteobacteria bacterium]